MASVANVSELINQLIGLSHKTEDNKEQQICQCSIGKLKVGEESEYTTIGQCNKGFVCYYVATEKHLAGKMSHVLNMKINNKIVPNISSKDVVTNKEVNVRIELDSIDSIFL